MTEIFVMWNGTRYGLYGDGYFRKGGRYLHREKWAKLRGPIPPGHHVHHKNHNRADNRMCNLELLTKSAHMSHHSVGRKVSEDAKAKRAAWWSDNKAEVGKKISLAHAARVRISKKCAWCGENMTAFNSYKTLCSLACHQNRRYHAGIDNETRTCAWCGKEFKVNKHKPPQGCSKSCGQRLAWRRIKDT